MAELADAPDLGSGPARGGGSNPPFRTTAMEVQRCWRKGRRGGAWRGAQVPCFQRGIFDVGESSSRLLSQVWAKSQSSCNRFIENKGVIGFELQLGCDLAISKNQKSRNELRNKDLSL